tara:strand:+ start:232 stop:462 length:231 start_codon:yes stop_codon:yes gene_type:complete
MDIEKQSNNFFNLQDLINTLTVNDSLYLNRVHGGTANEDTVSDLLHDLVQALYELGGLDKDDWNNLSEQLEELKDG